ncbi:fasciclin-like arabinogalactan protein 12 [Prunus yedoensis var. nudiflora]|uniref:Fasciclin-like arabinogalactan protein 12 n=1 Tax=Prunus yedoensis var. nudiflora TaxID=2094558 RepID=A0A314XKU2_PRUYE|nr:fasciclin-like arabinogalactan protein 12 [Prunus yedoensis var. nudiflora]
MKMMNQPLFSLTLLLISLSHCTKILAQAPAAAPAAPAAPVAPAAPAAPSITGPAVPSPPADAPASLGPTNITKILEKAGGFNVLIRLLKSTQVDNQLYSQLNNSNSELTVLAPTDNGFSQLKTGSLNSLSDEQKVQLLQFHLIPDFLTVQNFQTLSNPVRTQAGDGFEYPLNITTSGRAVNISTGLVNTSISGTVYSDGQLAIYQVDSVLQPYGVFAPKPLPPSPAPAPVQEKPKKTSSSDDSPASAVKSGAVHTLISKLNGVVSIAVSVVAAAALSFL